MSRPSRVLDQDWKRASRERQQQGLCRWCGEDVKRFSSRRRSFCSDDCVNEYLIRADFGHARKLVYKRDKGVCAQCGLDCSKWFRAFKKWIYSIPGGYTIQGQSIREQAARHWFALCGVPYFEGWEHRSTFYDIDHIIPVEHGGGSCGLENLQLLCCSCHRSKTIQQNRSRGKKHITDQAVTLEVQGGPQEVNDESDLRREAIPDLPVGESDQQGIQALREGAQRG